MSVGRSTKFFFLVLVFVLLILLFGVGFLLYSALGIQKNLFRSEPSYTATQLYSKALEQTDKGDYDEAERYLEEALQKEESSTYRNKLAVVKYRLKKYEEAIEQYRKLIDQDKDPAFAWNGIGNAYRDWASQDSAQSDNYLREAEAAYRRVMQIDAGYAAAYSNLALLLANQGKREEALTVINEGIAKTNREELQTIKNRL